MKIGILGTGMVGNTIGSKMIALGHVVKMGSRTENNEKGAEWVKKNGSRASQGTFASAASFGEIIFNCTSGGASLDVLKGIGAENLKGKILVDIANPLDFSKGMPPILIPGLCNTTSLGEEIQKAIPEARVVKTLNTTNAYIMINPSLLPGEHDMFICGNDETAKGEIKEILQSGFGWKSIIDLGDIANSRATEGILPIWIRLYGKFKSPEFNFKVVRKTV